MVGRRASSAVALLAISPSHSPSTICGWTTQTQLTPHPASYADRQVIVPKPLDLRQHNREYDAKRRKEKTPAVMKLSFEDKVRLWSKVLERTQPEPNSGCLLWLGAATPHGYGVVGFGGRCGVSVYVHRLAYEVAHGELLAGEHVLHRCDNPYCCNPDHLRSGMPADNTDDMIAKDRHCRGERSPAAKLTDNDILTIRKDARSLRLIALDYGVDIKQIHRIKRRENWKHVA